MQGSHHSPWQTVEPERAGSGGIAAPGRTLPLTQIPKFGIVLVVVFVLGALGFRDRKKTDVLQLICSVSLIANQSGFSRTRTTTSTSP